MTCGWQRRLYGSWTRSSPLRCESRIALPVAASIDGAPAARAAANTSSIAHKPTSASAVDTCVPLIRAMPSFGPSVRGAIPALMAAALVVAGCSGGGGGGQADAGGIGPQCTPGNAFDLNGRAGVQAILNVHVNASGLVETDTTAELLLLLDVTQTGRDVGVVARICDIKIPEVPIAGQDMPIRFELGTGLVESVPEVSGTGALDGDTTCATFTSDEITVLIGARLSPPDQGMLPQADDDGMFTECLPAGSDCLAAITNNCVCDQESDDKPGATLIAYNVPVVPIEEVYVDLRTEFTLSGQVFSSDEIIGEVDASLEQGILACTKQGGEACSKGEVNTVKTLNPVITPTEGEPSTFRAVRVDSELDCEMLIAMKDVLFPR